MVPAHTVLGSDSAPHLAYVMHGVLGSGHNLRSMARKLQEARPEYRFVLIDLRYHGKSKDAPPPHELESCVDDLIDLAEHLRQAPRVVIGHSLGGKVALAYGARHERENEKRRVPTKELAQIWTLDSDPGSQEPGDNHQVQKVVRALASNPGPFESRQHAVEAIENEGFSSGLANWLATNLERKDDGYRFRFEMDPIMSLLRDYFSIDYWPFLEGATSAPSDHHIRYELLVAENSDRWSGSMKERASRLQKGTRVTVHTLPDSGHWVHVDNPEGLHAILRDHLV